MLADHLAKRTEELIGQFTGCGIDQAAAQLGYLAADLRIYLIGKKRSLPIICKLHVGSALCKASYTPLAFPNDRVALRRIDIFKNYAAVEGSFNRADLGHHRSYQFLIRFLLQTLAARDAQFQHRWIVQRLPDAGARRRKLVLTFDFHRAALRDDLLSRLQQLAVFVTCTDEIVDVIDALLFQIRSQLLESARQCHGIDIVDSAEGD